MSFGDFMGLVAVMGGLVAMTAIFASFLRRRMEHKERMAEIKAGAGQLPSNETARNATDALPQHRALVLERIATDKTQTLAAQIEDLRQDA